MGNDSIKKVLIVSFSLCIFCSVLVSGAAIFLKEKQQLNKIMDVKRNLLIASGVLGPSVTNEKEILAAYTKVTELAVDLSTGEIVDGVNVESLDTRKLAKTAGENIVLSSGDDIAKIKTISKISKVYLVRNDLNEVEKIVLPVHGKGLWSTLYGFLALAPDTKTIKGLGFYEHGETPGLGGEVDNPRWKKNWANKVVLDDNFDPQIVIVKGQVDHKLDANNNKIDGLSGATITSNGVQALVNFWVSGNGYGPFLAKYRKGEVL
jgi:Na+-transporting NADH:ubiquinone oxidoreductase subunit C